MSGEDTKTLSEVDIKSVVEKTMGSSLTNIIMDSQILTALMSCPRYTDFRFNLNLVSIDGKSNSLECGSLVHTILEYFYKAIIFGTSREQAIQLGFTAGQTYIRGCVACSGFIATPEQAKPLCGHKPNEFPGMKNTPRDSEGYKTGWQYVLDTMDQYFLHYRNDHWIPLEVETVKQEILYQDDEIRILWKAKLDLLADTNQGIKALDHKTMKARRNTNSMNNQFMGQCIITKQQNIILNKIGFQQTLKPEEKFIRTPVNYSTERLFEWQSETLPFYAKMLVMYAEIGHWPPDFTSCEGRYGDCPFYKTVCEHNPSMREEQLKKHFMVGPVWNPTNDEDE